MFRKPGKGTITLLLITTIISLLTVIYERLGINSLEFFSLNTHKFPDPYFWKYLTTGFIIPPTNPTNLIFSLLGVYFLGSMLESVLSYKKLLILSFISILISFLFTEVLGLIFGVSKWFAPLYPFGLGVLFATLGSAYGKLMPKSNINVMFILPVKGKWFAFIPVAFILFDVLYGIPPTEGIFSILIATLIGWNFNWFVYNKYTITQFVTKGRYSIENKEKNKILN